ncbi:DUF1622 domain-containing protein [Streptomyces sp. SID13726]|uniref:DUF1622 domain-containing protein n=1 Tax=Streptomyces sp. SID13726 TaxID=2706058 RepID=UPI0013BDAFB4|nr:DUF1622 domain-containing protein [Streptomyces sp. SID13726]NEB03358.1 DUF1622 domain-containing protein [Streptomyces sp. SID13726]
MLAWEFLPDSTLHDTVEILARLVEFAGAVVIFVGAIIAFLGFATESLRATRRSGTGKSAAAGDFNRVRLGLGRFLALGLEFQLAGDILRTAVAPTFTQIGQLAAIAAIRTALNYFLGKEIKEQRREVEGTTGTHPASSAWSS